MPETPSAASEQEPSDPPLDPPLAERRTLALEDLKRELAEDPTGDDEQAYAQAAVNLRKTLASLNGVARVNEIARASLGIDRISTLPAFKVPNLTDQFPVLKNPAFNRTGSSAVLKALERSAGRGALSGIKFDALPNTAYANLTQGFNSALTAQVNSIAKTALGGLNAPNFAMNRYMPPATSSVLSGTAYTNLTRGISARTALGGRADSIAKTALGGIAARNIDFGIDRYLKSFPAIDADYFRRLYERFQPRNLRDADVDIVEVEVIMRSEGIPFCLTPDPQTAELLTAADNAAERRRILTERAQDIFDACDDVVALCINEDLPEQGRLIRAAISAYSDGHAEAAQTLATVVLDQLVARHVNHTNIKSASTGHGFIDERMGNREALFLLPIPVAHIKTDDITDASLYNRHATVHKSSSNQLTPANAVQAVMLASSLLGYHQNLW